MSRKHGANLFELSQKYGFDLREIKDFSSNINPLGFSQKAKNRLIKDIDLISTYPDVDYKSLKDSISKYIKTPDEFILLGNGATELISKFIQKIKPKKALLIAPAYSEYEVELKKINCSIDYYFMREENDFKIDVNNLVSTLNDKDYNLLIICNPNNPTGYALSKIEVESILKQFSGFVMIDETYEEFCETCEYASSSLAYNFENIFVIRGTSKFFSTPGIRLGYAVLGNKHILKELNDDMDLWNINICATLLGETMFLDNDFINNTKTFILNQKRYLIESLNKIKDLKVFPTQSNFILCKINSKKITADELYHKLIPKKIAIRNASSFDGLDAYFFRICILDEKSNKDFIYELSKIFS